MEKYRLPPFQGKMARLHDADYQSCAVVAELVDAQR